MEKNQYYRAMHIRERIRQIEILLRRIETNSYDELGISVIGISADYKINKEMKPVLSAMLKAEKEELEKEFESL